MPTGEVIALDDPVGCAKALYEISQLEQRIRDIKSALREVIFDESIRLGTKTIHLEGGMTAKVSTPSDVQWDYDVLIELMEAGLPPERFEALVMAEVTYKVNGAIVKELEGANPKYGEIINRARTRVPRTPSVSVSPGKTV